MEKYRKRLACAAAACAVSTALALVALAWCVASATRGEENNV